MKFCIFFTPEKYNVRSRMLICKQFLRKDGFLRAFKGKQFFAEVGGKRIQGIGLISCGGNSERVELCQRPGEDLVV